MTKTSTSLPQAITEFVSTNNRALQSHFKFVNAGYLDLLLMEGAEQQQQFLKVCLYCWNVLMKMLFTKATDGPTWLNSYRNSSCLTL